MPYLTPASSPVHELPSELGGVSAAAVAVAEQATQGSSSSCGAQAGGYDIGVRPRIALSQEWASQYPSSSLEQSQSSQGGTGQSTGSKTGSQGRPREILLKFNAPDDMEISTILCTFTHMEDVEDFSKHAPTCTTYLNVFS